MNTFVLKDGTSRMSDDEFLKFCLENPDLRIERNSDLEIVIMSPVSSKSSSSSMAVAAQLYSWAYEIGNGVVFDSSGGFTLPDQSVLSPDASWISNERWNQLSEADQNRFAPLCPDFIIEVRSKSDSLSYLKEKMKIWIKNGARLGWLIDPIVRTVFIYRPGCPEEQIENFNVKIKGEGPVEGFMLDLSRLPR